MPVRLKYAKSETFSPGGGIGGVQDTRVLVRVANLAFTKHVTLHCRAGDGSWAQRPLGWQAGFGDYDLFTLTENAFFTQEFAVRYDVAGSTYWDNNNGGNFQLSSVAQNTVGGLVSLDEAVARRGTQAGGGFTVQTSWVEGSILVVNRSYGKRVGIRLTANGWASHADTLASYAGVAPVYSGMSQVERWSFRTPELNLDTSDPQFRFAVFYQDLDHNQEHWDNALGGDYRLDKLAGSRLL